MFSSKIWASAALWLLLALSSAYGQSTDVLATIPKWEFGLRGGGGFNLSHFKKEGNVTYVYPERQVVQENYLGGFAARNFNQRWSLRSELSWVTRPGSENAISIGVYPRYHLTKWFGLEAGIEARNLLAGDEKNGSKLWLGTAFSWKNMELNVRYSPRLMPKTAYLMQNWQNTFQVGASFNLAKIGKVFSGKK